MSRSLKSIIRFYYTGDSFEEYFNGIYPFTTESISGYIDYFDLKDKSLLTVGSSGDQAINAILKGCKDVTVLDINPYTKYYYYLKVASIISLEMEEFLNYFRLIGYTKKNKPNKEAFNKDIYLKVRRALYELDPDSLAFWDKQYKSRRPITIRRSLFSTDEYCTSIIKQCNPYLQSEELYKETKCKVQSIKPTFITQDVIKDEIQGSYDNIWLSNIGAYINLETLLQLVAKTNELLTKQGRLLIGYLYDFDKNTEYQKGWDQIYDLKRVFSILQAFSPELKSFKGIDSNDSVLISVNNRKK